MSACEVGAVAAFGVIGTMLQSCMLSAKEVAGHLGDAENSVSSHSEKKRHSAVCCTRIKINGQDIERFFQDKGV